MKKVPKHLEHIVDVVLAYHPPKKKKLAPLKKKAKKKPNK
jgi:hypothetical protein